MFTSMRTKLLKDFDDGDLRTFLDRLAANDVGSRSVQIAYETLRAAYRYAAQRRYVDTSTSPFLYVDKPVHESKRKDALTNDQLGRLMGAIRDTKVPRSRTLLLLLVTTGLRIGEALGLEWEHVDLHKGEVKVRQQLVGSKPAPLKTKESHRDVPLVPEAVAALRALKASSKSKTWVFGSRTSERPVDASNFRSEVFAPMLERAGLADSGLTPHGLRSVAASLVAPHVDPVVLTKMFGWTTVNVAAKFYVRAGEALRDQGRNAMVTALERVDQRAKSA
jgi:integrase